MTDRRSSRRGFAGLIGRVVQSLNVLDRDQKVCCGITVSQCYTVEALARRGPMSINELSQEVGVATSTMSRVVDVLVRDGVLSRTGNQGDRRRVRVSLTAKGRGLGSELMRCLDEYSREVLSRIPSGQRKRVVSSLAVLADALEGVAPRRDKCSLSGR